MVEKAEATDQISPRQKLLELIGHKISEARHARNEHIDEAVRKLKLRKSHLEALEKGNWDELPDDVYALGFLRQYCNYLELDLSEEIEDLKDNQYHMSTPLTFPDMAVAPSWRWAWISAALFVLLFIVFNVMNNRNEDNFKSSKAEVAGTTRTPPLTTAANTSAKDDTTKRLPQDILAGQKQQSVPPKKLKTISEEDHTHPTHPKRIASTSNKKTDSNHKQPQQIRAIQPLQATTSAPTTSKVIIPHRYHFMAVGDAVWMQIYLPDAQGKKQEDPYKVVLLKQGKSTSVKTAAETVWITCGNAPALRVEADGHLLFQAGTLGSGRRKVLHDFKITLPDTL